MTKVCVSLKGRDTQSTLRTIGELSEADLFEIRLDYQVAAIDLEAIREATSLPLVATNRRRNPPEPEKHRLDLLEKAAERGFNYVDLETETPCLLELAGGLRRRGVGVILSHHSRRALTLSELEGLHAGLARHCDAVKLVGWARCPEDNLAYLEFNRRHPGNICFAMGEAGVLSRVLAPLWGALFTYASPSWEEAVAPGQLPLGFMREAYRRMGL